MLLVDNESIIIRLVFALRVTLIIRVRNVNALVAVAFVTRVRRLHLHRLHRALPHQRLGRRLVIFVLRVVAARRKQLKPPGLLSDTSRKSVEY